MIIRLRFKVIISKDIKFTHNLEIYLNYSVISVFSVANFIRRIPVVSAGNRYWILFRRY